MECGASGAAAGTVAAALQFFAASHCLLQEFWPPQATLHNGSEFDFIVVGGGSAGAALAARLSEGSHSVLLLEAGGDPPLESIIPGFRDVMKSSPVDWNFTTTDDHFSSQALQDGSQRQPRGKMLGGSGSINDMIYSRGFPADYDDWAAELGVAWSWQTVLEFFKKTEHLTDERFLDDPSLCELHGFGGEIEVTGVDESTQATDMFLSTFEELGFKIVRDMTNPYEIGAGRFSHTIRAGRRDSSATAMLNQARHRTNLHVLKNALATNVLIERKRAYGVEVLVNGETWHAYARKEVVLSAGTFNTPKLLLLSGVGPRAHLEALGIPASHDLPVGHNLHDHIMVLSFIASDEGTCASAQNERHLNIVEYLYDRRGFFSRTSDLAAYLAFNDSAPNVPDFAIYPSCMPRGDHFYDVCRNVLGFKPYVCEKVASENSRREILTVAVVNLKPKSRGRVMLNSTDPLVPPLIYSGTFSDDRDLLHYPAALRTALAIANGTYFREKHAEVIDLGIEECAGLDGDEGLRCYARAMATSAWHAAGTVAMGGVLDGRLRVRGVRGLRVADASVMPRIVRGNTNAPVVMIAERAAHFIREEHA